MSKDCNNACADSQRVCKFEDLRYHDILSNFEEIFRKYYSPQNKVVYRWVHNPPVKDDEVPQVYQSFNSEASPFLYINKSLPEEVCKDIINRCGLSVFENAACCEETFKNIYFTFKDEKKRQLFLQKKGAYIAVLNITEKDGWLENKSSKNGHLNFHPSKYFQLDDKIVYSYCVDIKTERNEKE